MNYKTCSYTGCTNFHYCATYCRKHYQRMLRHGDPAIVLQPGTKLKVRCRECGGERDPRIPEALCEKCYKRLRYEYCKKYRKKHPKFNRIQCRKNYLKNRQKRLEYQRAYQKRKREEECKKRSKRSVHP